MEITVKKIEHLHDVSYRLDADVLGPIPDDVFVVSIATEGIVDGWPLTIPAQALDTRKAIYGLETDEEALDAIIREMGFALKPVIHKLPVRPIRDVDPSCEYLDWRKEAEQNNVPKKLAPEGDEFHHKLGGLHSEIKITYEGDTKKQRAAALKKVGGRPELPVAHQAVLRARALSKNGTHAEAFEILELNQGPQAAARPAGRDDFELAELVLKQLRNGEQKTVDELAFYFDEEPDRIRTVLDEFEVKGDTVLRQGPGAGGGWPS